MNSCIDTMRGRTPGSEGGFAIYVSCSRLPWGAFLFNLDSSNNSEYLKTTNMISLASSRIARSFK